MVTAGYQAQTIDGADKWCIQDSTDHDLVAAVRDGDEVAFQEIVRRYKNPIVSFIYRMIDDYERSVELSQETFIRIYTSAARYQATFTFSTYIYKIASNLAISELRMRKRRKVVSLFLPFLTEEGEAVELDPPDKNPLQDESLIEEERRLAVAAVILMVFAVFQSGIYKNQPGGKQLSSESVNSLPGVVTTQPTNGDKSPQKGESRGSSTLIAETKPHDYQAKPSGASQRISLRPKSPRISNSIGDTAAVILLRENSREFQVSIPTISVGAQPIAYVSQVSEVSHGTQIAY